MEPSQSSLPIGKDLEGNRKRIEAKLCNANQQGEQGRDNEGEAGNAKHYFL